LPTFHPRTFPLRGHLRREFVIGSTGTRLDGPIVREEELILPDEKALHIRDKREGYLRPNGERRDVESINMTAVAMWLGPLRPQRDKEVRFGQLHRMKRLSGKPNSRKCFVSAVVEARNQSFCRVGKGPETVYESITPGQRRLDE
jgi:hypothetical protein